MENIDVVKRQLNDAQASRVRFDLGFRGIVSLASALCVFIFAAMLSIYGNSLFVARGLAPLCHGGIWIAVIAVNFGLIRTGIQLLAWRNGRHYGVIVEGERSGGLMESLFNAVSALIFIGLGIAVLLTGGSLIDGLRTATQIPMALLSITFGLSSAESSLFYFWRQKSGYNDFIHEISDRI